MFIVFLLLITKTLMWHWWNIDVTSMLWHFVTLMLHRWNIYVTSMSVLNFFLHWCYIDETCMSHPFLNQISVFPKFRFVSKFLLRVVTKNKKLLKWPHKKYGRNHVNARFFCKTIRKSGWQSKTRLEQLNSYGNGWLSSNRVITITNRITYINLHHIVWAWTAEQFFSQYSKMQNAEWTIFEHLHFVISRGGGKLEKSPGMIHLGSLHPCFMDESENSHPCFSHDSWMKHQFNFHPCFMDE